jgi:hypothetical protein
MHNGQYRKGYIGTNIYILSDSQAAIKALNNFQINSKPSLRRLLAPDETGRT